MQKLAVITFSLIYLLLTTGFGLEIHYCMGRITDFSHALADTSCPCDAFHAEEESGCCTEESFFVMLDTDQLSQSNKVDLKPKGDCILLLNEYSFSGSEVDTHTEVQINGPPRAFDRVVTYCSLVVYS